MKGNNASYSALGSWFEYLNCDCDYPSWSQYLIMLLKKYGAGISGADVGCGNGYFTREFALNGYDVVGVDVSCTMLNKAVQISAEKGVNVAFLQGDITKLKLAKKVDFITAINDCINYVSQADVVKTFRKVSANLKKGGLFIFDVSSKNKLENVIGNNMFGEDGEELSYLWFNEKVGDKIVMDLTFFERLDDGKYKRYDERHVQYIHEERSLVSALEDSGFKVEEVTGRLGGEKTERINFVARKI